MKKLLLLTKTLLAAALLCVGQNAWAQDLTPVYFNDFNTGNGTTAPTGMTIHGGGTFVDEGNSLFGKVFQNGGGAQRTHYLQLPADVLSHSASSKKMTIGFWVNKGNAGASNTYMWAPLFTAYVKAPISNANTFPMLACQYRGVLQVNNVGWCDYVDCQNVKGSNTLYHDATDWLADGGWHYYTVVFDDQTASVYFDGVLKNQWNAAKEYWKLKVAPGTIVDKEPADPSGYDHCVTTQAGLYSNGADLVYVCLGGNQAWDWGDNDAAFKFDDFAVYDEALSVAQITQIMKTKYSVPVEVSDAGYATFSSTHPVNVNVTGLEAYIATGENGGYITMQKVTGDVAANTGLVLKGAAKTYNLPVVASGTTYNTESDPKNYLFAISSNYNLNKSNNGTNYVLTVQNSNVVWAPINGTAAAVTAGHSALWLPASGSPQARAMRFSGDITGVANVEAAAEAKAQDGKFIENGKLVIIKNGVKYNAAGQQVK